ncbi:MAG: type II toxin-antitoxin system VapC family toxin [Anaerolineales bacterium]|nr:type II toxin-antitoxin system VapC family toxin [Anaerolineales bacterium]
MSYLLDTHTFLWWATNPARLSSTCQQLLTENETILLSVVTIWELQIKIQTGKLRLALPLAQLVQEQIEQNNLQLLPVHLGHVLALEQFPLHHRDPFDRLLAAQTQVEQATLLTADTAFSAYNVPTLW